MASTDRNTLDGLKMQTETGKVSQSARQRRRFVSVEGPLRDALKYTKENAENRRAVSGKI